MRTVGGNRTRYLRLRHNCALSDELQPHAGRKLLEFAKFVDGSFNYVDKVILYGCCVTTTLYTKAPQINLCGAFAFYYSKMIRELFIALLIGF